MSTYPTYKPSGIEWLGDIPEHWISTRVKNALVFDIGGTPSRNKMEYFDGDNLWVSIADLNNQDLITDTNEKITDEAIENSNCKLIPKDSLLFSFKLSVGHLAFAGSNLYTNEAIAAFRPSNRLNVRFLKYLLQIEFESNANTNIYGAYLFNKETLGAAKIVFPDDSKEQTIIANYLDEKTTKLDELISNKKSQIDKLKEIRQIEINKAVTKGLDPTVTLRPSGIDWLGDIPEHWEVKRLKNLLTIFGRIGFRGYTIEDIVDEGEGAISLSPSNIKNDKLVFDSKTYLSWFKYEESPEIQIFKDDIIYVKTGSTIGKVAYVDRVPEPMTLNPQNVVFKNIRVDSKYLYHCLQCDLAKIQTKFGIIGGATPALSQEKLYEFRVVVPPTKNEQIAIANYLDEKTSKIDQLVSNLENQIEQLKEVRKIEIYNAVTGKIKVV